MKKQACRPSSTKDKSTAVVGQTLTDAQHAFAEVLGRELVRYWIDGQHVSSVTSQQKARSGVRHEKSQKQPSPSEPT